jgi:hypothetical protein
MLENPFIKFPSQIHEIASFGRRSEQEFPYRFITQEFFGRMYGHVLKIRVIDFSGLIDLLNHWFLLLIEEILALHNFKSALHVLYKYL